jgi:hypothetical protein
LFESGLKAAGLAALRSWNQFQGMDLFKVRDREIGEAQFVRVAGAEISQNPIEQRRVKTELAGNSTRRLEITGGDIVCVVDDDMRDGIYQHGYSPNSQFGNGTIRSSVG